MKIGFIGRGSVGSPMAGYLIMWRVSRNAPTLESLTRRS